MSPVAPRRARPKRVAKSVQRKARAPAEQTTKNWDLVQSNNADEHDSDIENEDPNPDYEPPLAIEQQAAQTLDQLHRMTAGLEREVESFAVDLDRLLDDLRPDDEYDAVHDLVLSFRNHATMEVSELEKEYGRERREQLARDWLSQAKPWSNGVRRGSDIQTNLLPFAFAKSKAPDPKVRTALQSRSISAEAYASPHAQELRTYQEEADTWELFRINLELHYNPNNEQMQEEVQAELEKLGHVHKYTPETDIYQRFTLTDSLALERSLVKVWLEQSSEFSQTKVDDLMRELEKGPKGEKIAWTRGWMHSREDIKREKRLRAWPAPDSSPLPQLRSNESNELLVTSLDPDAPSRQHRSLEQQDALLEQALWIASWELLRRGKSWSEICDWAEAQKEGWRGALLGRGAVASDAPSLAIWRHACFVASKSKCSSDYEAAVYGLLGGNVTAAQKVCHTVDDRLFAFYSTALVQQFDRYLSIHYPERMPAALLASPEYPSRAAEADAVQATIMDLIKQLRMRPETRSESANPNKIIQAYLLANETGSLVHTVGSVIPDSQQLSHESSLRSSAHDSQLPEAGIAKSPTSLRIVAHIAIVLQLLRTSSLSVDEAVNEDNVIAAYITELNAAGKRELIPLYASRLQPERCVTAMAIVLEGVVDSRERSTLLSLMQQKSIDVPSVLWHMLESVIAKVLAQSAAQKPASILQYTDDEPELYPGQRINLDDEPNVATSLDQSLVHHLEWFLLLPQHWDLTFSALSLAMRKVLSHGRFACARLIVENLKTDLICQEKTYRILGRSVNLFSPDVSRPAERDEAHQWDIMQRQARTYHELEQLVNVYELLFAWRKQEQLYAHATPRSPSVPKELKTTFAELAEAMDPILDIDGFLLDTTDEAEKEDINIIREAYVTDAIIAYNTVLYGAGRLISRDMLLQSMDLATIVAKESTRLTETFASAGRLKELVTSFAFSSKAILVMKATGKPWKPRYERRQGRDVSIWDVVPRRSTEKEHAALTIS